MMSASGFIVTGEMIDAVHAWRQLDLDGRVRRPIVALLVERFKIDPASAIAIIRKANEGGANASGS